MIPWREVLAEPSPPIRFQLVCPKGAKAPVQARLPCGPKALRLASSMLRLGGGSPPTSAQRFPLLLLGERAGVRSMLERNFRHPPERQCRNRPSCKCMPASAPASSQQHRSSRSCSRPLPVESAKIAVPPFAEICLRSPRPPDGLFFFCVRTEYDAAWSGKACHIVPDSILGRSSGLEVCVSFVIPTITEAKVCEGLARL